MIDWFFLILVQSQADGHSSIGKEKHKPKSPLFFPVAVELTILSSNAYTPPYLTAILWGSPVFCSFACSFHGMHLASCFFFWLLHFINIIHIHMYKCSVSELLGILAFPRLILPFLYCFYSTSREEERRAIKWRSVHPCVNAHWFHHSMAHSQHSRNITFNKGAVTNEAFQPHSRFSVDLHAE